MYNWSHIDEDAMKKENPQNYKKWRIIQMLNYDLEGEKLDKKDVMILWPEIKSEITPEIRRLIEFILWGKKYSLPINVSFWNRLPETRK